MIFMRDVLLLLLDGLCSRSCSRQGPYWRKRKRKRNARTLYRHECEPVTLMFSSTSRGVTLGVMPLLGGGLYWLNHIRDLIELREKERGLERGLVKMHSFAHSLIIIGIELSPLLILFSPNVALWFANEKTIKNQIVMSRMCTHHGVVYFVLKCDF